MISFKGFLGELCGERFRIVDLSVKPPLSLNVAPVPDVKHNDRPCRVVDVVNYAVSSHPNPPAFSPNEFLASVGSWIVRKH